jgi:hypothetical protein
VTLRSRLGAFADRLVGSPTLALLASVSAGAVYGLVCRILFSGDTGPVGVLVAMSVSFVFLVPVGIGFLTLTLAPDQLLDSRAYRILSPWMASLLGLLGVWATGWEGKICIAMMLPVMLPLSNLGGLIAYRMRRRPRMRGRMYAAGVFSILLLPYVAGPVEGGIPPAMRLRTVERAIRIHAAPDDVWRQIVRVPRIRPEEYGSSLVHRIGFPRPVEATLSHPGVGGVRRASFERGVVFVETVTAWEPDRLLAFTIHADPTTIPPGALDEHVTVGGEYFDVLDGTYRIEPAGPRDVVLHLSSTHRLSTRFNFYASLWSDLVMGQIQANILQVVKHRAEAG